MRRIAKSYPHASLVYVVWMRKRLILKERPVVTSRAAISKCQWEAYALLVFLKVLMQPLCRVDKITGLSENKENQENIEGGYRRIWNMFSW